jgi:hypothetical protein
MTLDQIETKKEMERQLSGFLRFAADRLRVCGSSRFETEREGDFLKMLCIVKDRTADQNEVIHFERTFPIINTTTGNIFSGVSYDDYMRALDELVDLIMRRFNIDQSDKLSTQFLD